MIKGRVKPARNVVKPKSGIQWTDRTMNFWTGCKKVGLGCAFCYADRLTTSFGKNFSKVTRASDKYFYSASNWPPSKIFTCSMSDFFIEDADTWRDDAWEVIRSNPQHTWQILTKRPERILQCLPPDWGDRWKHVWLGVSIEHQKYMHRADILSKVPAWRRFISAEPLLGPLDFINSPDGQAVLKYFHWIIIGGESGVTDPSGKALYRPCDVAWIEQIINQVQGTQVEVFVKQMGTYLGKQMKMMGFHGDQWSKFPPHLKIRNFPK